MIAGEAAARAFVAARCDAQAMARLDAYVAALGAENAQQNLVSARSLEEVWQRHIADSAQLLDHVPRETAPWLDLGSGPGLPGLVLAIMRPQAGFVLVESRRRRIEFLARVAEELDLPNVRIEGRRVERVAAFPAAVITARAFAPLPALLDLSVRFSTADTHWLLPKGRSAAQELAELPPRWRAMFHVERSQTDPEAGIVVGRLARRKGMTG